MIIAVLFCFVLSVFLILSIACSECEAKPEPGDVFREYMWYNEGGDAGGSLRVGGKHGDTHLDRGWAHNFINTPIILNHNIDLENAIKAEAVIEKILCHDGTTGLSIEINNSGWIEVPEAENIPVPQWEYQHHIYPVVPIPLSQLKVGPGNEFRMKVDAKHTWNWPQNLIYGVHIRIYYDPASKSHPSGRVTAPESGASLGEIVELKSDVQVADSKIKQVEYIGHYEDVNFEGDGEYRQWHYHYFHGQIMNHVGTASDAPYCVTWDISWIPDQDHPMKIAARIIDNTNLIYMTEAVTDLKLERPNYSVELCKPYNIPMQWVTRKGAKQENFDISGDLRKAVAAQLAWSSWCPGYMNGIDINGQRVFQNEGPKYQYYAHRVNIDDIGAFKNGQNILSTGGHAGNIHGMEVNWPGIMILIQYKM